MALGYARCRPALHAWIVRRIARQFEHPLPVRRALDLGCGSGLSTAPLAGLAQSTLGLEPSIPMFAWSRQVAPEAVFVGGQVERMPFCNDSFDLITAAGSLNYADLSNAFAEIARILQPAGSFFLYDFSTGRSLKDSDRLDRWFDTFLARFPAAKDSWKEITQAILLQESNPLRLLSFRPFATDLIYDLDTYIDYLMTETNVAQAISEGHTETAIRGWCRHTLGEIFGKKSLPVQFRGYIAHLTR